MLLDFLIFYNKKKLDFMITIKTSYERVLKHSQKLDVLINEKMKTQLGN